MGKNKQPKDEAPSPNSVANRETFQRLNFLYQASAYLRGIDTFALAEPRESGDQGSQRDRKKRRKRRIATLGDIGSSYVQCMRTIGNKSVVRMDPNVKRTLCKGCDAVLLPGITASIRVKGSPNKGHSIVYACLACNLSRTIPAPPVAHSGAPALSFPPATDSSAAEVPLFGHLKNGRKQAPRSLPLFARVDAGHVIFRGNERLKDAH
ncbi:Rpr2-domain-containing protein [Ramaria rubella]|nr:Rpr2-domain-containing protein [Ramaria rubella]